MKHLTKIEIKDRSGKVVCRDDEGEYDQKTRTLVIKSARWLISQPARQIGNRFTVKANEAVSADTFLNDMEFVQETNNVLRCRFVGS